MHIQHMNAGALSDHDTLQGTAVHPKRGRLLMFPCAFTYVHAGRRPESQTKYDIVNFITHPRSSLASANASTVPHMPWMP